MQTYQVSHWNSPVALKTSQVVLKCVSLLLIYLYKYRKMEFPFPARQALISVKECTKGQFEEKRINSQRNTTVRCLESIY